MHGEFAVRWLYPLVALRDDGLLKSVLSTLGAILGSLFVADPQWVLLVTLLVILDFASGVLAARMRSEKIGSWGIRQTGIKAFEYIMLLAACMMVANSFELVDWLDTTAFMYVSLTELKSIVENVTDPDGTGRKVWKLIQNELTNRAGVNLEEEKDDETGA